MGEHETNTRILYQNHLCFVSAICLSIAFTNVCHVSWAHNVWGNCIPAMVLVCFGIFPAEQWTVKFTHWGCFHVQSLGMVAASVFALSLLYSHLFSSIGASAMYFNSPNQYWIISNVLAVCVCLLRVRFNFGVKLKLWQKKFYAHTAHATKCYRSFRFDFWDWRSFSGAHFRLAINF